MSAGKNGEVFGEVPGVNGVARKEVLGVRGAASEVNGEVTGARGAAVAAREEALGARGAAAAAGVEAIGVRGAASAGAVSGAGAASGADAASGAGVTDACVLAVQLGNMETTCGVFVAGKLAAHWTTATRPYATPDDLELELRAFLAAKSADITLAPNQAIICSVVPAAENAWKQALSAVCACRPVVVGPGLKTGLSLKYKDPAQVGSDRVACAVAARRLYGPGVIVVDFSHATTAFSVVDEKGAFAGGVIAPGLGVSMSAMETSAAQLVLPALRAPQKVLARSTAAAIESGVIMGEVLRTNGFIDTLWQELGGETKLVATGHYAALITGRTTHAFAVEPHLALLGLYELWELNCK